MTLRRFSFLMPALFIISCGGGGGGGSSAAPIIPLASINFSTTFGSEVDVGTNFIFSWSTTNASSCNASGDWSGSVTTSGSYQKNLDSAGEYSFTLSCSNSEGAQASKTLSVVANYVIIRGTIFDSDNSNKTVYIDENFNNINDQLEPSAVSDSNGIYEIRYIDPSTCLKNFPVKVENSALGSFNPPGYSEVNISAATSLFREFYNYFPRNEYSSEICNSDKLREKNRWDTFFNEVMAGITFSEGYTYAEIQADPSSSSRSSISYNRFDDINLFQNSLDTVTGELIDAIKSKMDSTLVGIDSNDFEFRYSSEFDDANVRIFLNDNTYPNPITNLDPVANGVDAVSIQANFGIYIDNIGSLPDYDVNGWDEKLYIQIPDILINNNNQVVSDTSTCWINFTSLCIQEINFDLINLNNATIYTTTEMSKTTSRGLEKYEWDEYFLSSIGYCDIFASTSISENIGGGLKKVTDYTNNYWPASYTNFGDGSANYCLYNSGTLYKYMQHFIPFEDGTYVNLQWDSNAIDNLENLQESGWYDDEDPPPNTIPQDQVNLMADRPDLYDLYPDFDVASGQPGTEEFSIIWNWYLDMLLNKIDTSEFYWFSMFINNISGGNARVLVTNENGYPYARCDVNGNMLFDSTQVGYDIDAAAYAIQTCIFLQDDNGNSLLSRKSIITDQQTYCSPYGGCFDIIQSSSSNTAGSKALDNEFKSFNGDGSSSTFFRSKPYRSPDRRKDWSHLSDSN